MHRYRNTNLFVTSASVVFIISSFFLKSIGTVMYVSKANHVYFTTFRPYPNNCDVVVPVHPHVSPACWYAETCCSEA